MNILPGYKPYAHQKKFHESGAKYRLIGGARGPGKTTALIAESVMRAHMYGIPVSIGMIRRTYPELERTLIREMLGMLDPSMYRYNAAQHVLTWTAGPGVGGHIDFIHLESDEDVYKYKSHEWDFIGWDEITENTEYQFIYLLGSLRSTKPGVNVKFYAGTNPTGIGAGWVKARFVSKTCTESGYNPAEYEFIPARVFDNKALIKNDPDYVKRLEALPEQERKALLYGSWDALQGMFFPEFSVEKHVVKPFPVPEDWRLILAIDEGRATDPRAGLILGVDVDSHVWVVWEYYVKGKNLREGMEDLRKQLQEAGYWGRVYKCVVPADIKNSAPEIGSMKILEDMGFGFQLGHVELADRNRQEGWRVLKSYLSARPWEDPLLKIFSCCHNLLRTLPTLAYYKATTGGKKEDIDSRQEDHMADCLRYGIMSLEWRPSRFGGTQIRADHFIKPIAREYVPRTTYGSFGRKH